MARIRSGGSGRTGSLRQQFNYYKRQLYNRLIDEEAFERALGGGADLTPSMLFKKLNYDTILKEGVTRKVGNTTVRLEGESAIKVQIGSLRRRASKSEQAQLFIENFVNSLTSDKKDSRGRIIGLQMPEEYAYKIYKKLQSISIDKLTYLIRKGILKAPTFHYDSNYTWEELYEMIMNAIDNGVSKETLKDIQAKKKQLKPFIKGLFETMYKW